ncbi:MAG: aminopeptidase P family protein [Clostridia bacterium]|nr:aminopeptidase P family protein [Clostridia bacterium]
MKTERIARVIARMKDENLSQILVTSPNSVYYLTGMYIEPGERMLALLIKDNGDVTLFANRLFALTHTSTAPLVEYDDTEDSVAILAACLNPGTVGIDKFWPSQFTIRLMAARRDITPVLGSRPVDLCRMLKDEEEVKLMIEASKLNDRIIENTITHIVPGMTEEEVSQMYSRYAKAEGINGSSFEALICFGENCAEPHHATDDTLLKDGDSIILDVGVPYQRYCSDMTRTVFFRSATDEQKRVYEITEKANAAGRAAVRPGVPLKDIDRAARKVIEDAGYGKYFIHRTGHNIGLDVHELPDVSATSEAVAQPGMCFSVEPGIYLPGKFGVRVEDLVCVTEDGCLTLNALTKDFRIIG